MAVIQKMFDAWEARDKDAVKKLVHDNFIDDWSLINRIKNDKDFWKMGYYWWDGWWQSETTTLRHELIEFIYKDMYFSHFYM